MQICPGTLTNTTSGPPGESCGCHQYSPGWSGPAGVPVGVPLVWDDGFCTACAGLSRTTETARMARIFMDWNRWIPITAQTARRGNKTLVRSRRPSGMIQVRDVSGSRGWPLPKATMFSTVTRAISERASAVRNAWWAVMSTLGNVRRRASSSSWRI